MKSHRSIPRSGQFLSALALGLLAGCSVRYGFSQGAFPPNIKTMAVLPFDNQTPSPAVQSELFDAMRNDMQKRLGVRDAPQGTADAIVRGTIVEYDPDIPVSFSASPNQTVSARRKLQIVIDIEIVDQKSGKTLWQRKALSGDGEYAERAEQDGRKLAIQRIINDIIEGAQSQW